MDQVRVRELVEKSARGDLESFGELVRQYQRRAYGVAYGFLMNHSDAEDVSQEAFLQAFKKLSSFDGKGSFESWLLTIVARRSLNKIRWRKIREKFTFPLEFSPEGDPEDEPRKAQIADANPQIDPVAETGRTLLSRKLADALSALPQQQRTAVSLKVVQGYKISEVAKIMNLAEGTVKTHIFRGLESLKRILGEQPQ